MARCAQAIDGGLDSAVTEVLGGELAWLADNDPGAGKILTRHHPDVPNHGDITALNWADVEPVDLLEGGYPCQGQSDAGLRLGVDDERWIWPWIAAGVAWLRPQRVFFENVPGHLGRGFDVVLRDLDSLGYEVRWVTVRASDVLACHQRARIFILGSLRTVSVPSGRLAARLAGGRWCQAHEGLFGPVPFTGRFPAAGHMTGGRVYEEPSAGGASWNLPMLKTPTAQLADNGGSQHPDKRREGGHGPTLADQIEQEIRYHVPTPNASDWKGGNVPLGRTRDGRKRTAGDSDLPEVVARIVAAGLELGEVDWQEYEPAIRRHERAFGREVPPPAIPGRNSKPRLSPVFVEWMMCLAPGHVTAVPGLSLKEQLHALGNGAVQPQAGLALEFLLAEFSRSRWPEAV